MPDGLEPLGVIPTAHLYLGLHRKLMTLLRNLPADGWGRPTLARGWSVRDVAAHLLDVDVRRLSFQRDRMPVPKPDRPIATYDDLVRLLNTLNAEWILAARRMSPRVLAELLDVTGPQVAELVMSLDPHGPARAAVAWAGETSSENWFDIGRDYTERWHHQAQIRDAIGASPLDGPEWLRPVFELSMRAFVRALDDVRAAPGTALVLHITGTAGGTWSVVRSADAWSVCRGAATPAAARAECDTDTAWRLFFNALTEDEARRRIAGVGDEVLIHKVRTVRAVMV
jgi:uncharacterized protein (TIGR03083 family)